MHILHVDQCRAEAQQLQLPVAAAIIMQFTRRSCSELPVSVVSLKSWSKAIQLRTNVTSVH
jgi:hypothetical protein